MTVQTMEEIREALDVRRPPVFDRLKEQVEVHWRGERVVIALRLKQIAMLEEALDAKTFGEIFTKLDEALATPRGTARIVRLLVDDQGSEDDLSFIDVFAASAAIKALAVAIVSGLAPSKNGEGATDQ